MLIIAQREFMSYARTAGFWLTVLLPLLAGGLGFFAPQIIERASQDRALAVVDLTGENLGPRVQARLLEQADSRTARAMESVATASAGPEAGEAVEKAYDAGGLEAARAAFQREAPGAAQRFKLPRQTLRLVPPPAGLPSGREAVNAALRSYVAGDRALPDGSELHAAAVLHRTPEGLAVDLWSANLNGREVQDSVRSALRDEIRRDRLAAAGLGPDLLAQMDGISPKIRLLSPRAAAGGEVSLRDRLPTVVGVVLGFLLWSVVLTGAGVLLNSVMEEKASRVLEILAGSASTAEIMGGKILGVAALTVALLAVWAVLGAFTLFTAAPGMASDLLSTLASRGFLFYFAAYAVLGYVMYAATFAAIGAFCESPRDAQTLLTPIMLLLFVPVFFMTLAIENPDSTMLQVMSWIPPFTPFLMLGRAGGELAWWEVAGTLTLMVLTTALVVQLSGRAFRAGTLSTGKPDPKAWLAQLMGGRGAAAADPAERRAS
jgi:ABC-2 type transport system permease protein